MQLVFGVSKSLKSKNYASLQKNIFFNKNYFFKSPDFLVLKMSLFENSKMKSINLGTTLQRSFISMYGTTIPTGAA